MGNAYFYGGAAQGLSDGYEKARARTLEDEDRADLKAETAGRRSRRTLVEGRQDEAYNYDVAQRPIREEALRTQVDSQKESLTGVKEVNAERKETKPQRLRSLTLNNDAAEEGIATNKQQRRIQGNQESRAQTAFEKNQADAVQQAKDEGFDRFLDALEDGADPNYALSLFNAKGKVGIRPGTLKFDKETGRVQFDSSDGGKVQKVDTTLNVLRAALPREMRAKSPIKIGKDDRLISQQPDGSYKETLGPSSEQGGPRGAKFNRQTYIKDAESAVHELLGSKAFDSLTQQFVFDDSKRDVATLGSSFVGQVVRKFEEQGINVEPGEVARISADAARTIIGSEEARRSIVTDPKNKGKTKAEVDSLVEQYVRSSKIRARNQLELEIQNYISEMEGQQAAEGDLPNAEPSDEIADPAISAGPPDASLLKEGFAFKRKNGEVWTLEKGQPKRLK